MGKYIIIFIDQILIKRERKKTINEKREKINKKVREENFSKRIVQRKPEREKMNDREAEQF